MLTKRERFARWRGTRAQNEQSYINSALLICDYVHSIQRIDTIKKDFSSCESKTFQAFNVHGERAYGVLLYFKLKVDEAIERIAPAATTLKTLLMELNRILEGIYDEPMSNSSQKFNNFVKTIKQILAINPALIGDNSLAMSLCFDLYLVVTVLHLSISELNWIQKLAVNAVVDIDSGMKEITLLRRMAEAKAGQISKLMEPTTNANEVVVKSGDKFVGISSAEASFKRNPIQDHFNQDYLRLIKIKGSDELALSLLEEKIYGIKESINRLIIKRNKKEEIRLKIERVQVLVSLLDEYDRKEGNKPSLITLINANLELFNLVLENSNPTQKEQLVEKIKQLNTPSLYSLLPSQVLYGMGKVTSWLSVLYRSYMPQNLQDTVTARLPNAERDCKHQLYDLAQGCITAWTLEHTNVDADIAKLNYQLSDGCSELEELIAKETTVNLSDLVKANTAIKVALHEYRRISSFLLGAVWHFHVIRESSAVLEQFIHEHDGFLVTLSNFLAQILSFFKSDTAMMIEQAQEMKRQLMDFELQYRAEFIKEMEKIEQNPNIDPILKINLRQNIALAMKRTTNIIPYTSPSKEEVRYLTKNLEKLYGSGPGYELSGQNEPDIDDPSLLFLN